MGLSLATLLSQKNDVMAVDIIPEKIEKINKRISPIQDKEIEEFFAEKKLNLKATLDPEEAYKDAEYVIIAAPTNYDSQKNYFDTSAVETVIETVMKYNDHCIMVIKSTVPVGYTEKVREKYHTNRIIFSPEFLRESFDTLPSIISKCATSLLFVGTLSLSGVIGAFSGFRKTDSFPLSSSTYVKEYTLKHN